VVRRLRGSGIRASEDGFEVVQHERGGHVSW
jgi:hypothetical protein